MSRILKFILLSVLVFNLGLIEGSSQTKRGTKSRSPKTTPTPKTLNAQEIAKRFLPSVVLIICDDGQGNTSQGSGFFVAPGVILTNYHVIKGKVRGMAKYSTSGLKSDGSFIDQVKFIDPKNDLALLWLRNKDKFSNPAFKISDTTKMEVGEAIFVLSNPKGLEGTISKGLVSGSNRVIDDAELMQIDAPISPGSSGGAVLNGQGEIVGIATASLTGGQSLNFAVPAATIQDFIASSKTAKLTYDHLSAIENSWEFPSVQTNLPRIKTAEGASYRITPESMDYDEVAKELIETFTGSSFIEPADNSGWRINKFDIQGCSVQVTINVIVNGRTGDALSTVLDMRDVVSFDGTSFSAEVVKEILLRSNRDVLLNIRGELFYVQKSSSLPIRLKVRDVDYIFARFRRLKETCDDSASIKQPSLSESTKWLTEKIEGTVVSSESYMKKYDQLRFYGCNMVLSESFPLRNGDRITLYDPSLKYLERVEVTTNKYGMWGVWLHFSKNFEYRSQYLRLKDSEMTDTTTIFVEDSDNARRVGKAFARVMELCAETTKEPF